MDGWIVYKEADIEKNRVFINYLIVAAVACGMTAILMVRERLTLGVEHNALALFYDGARVVTLPNFSVNRCADALLSKQMEGMGIRVFNNASVCEVCNDKALTHQVVSSTGVKQLDTVFLTRNEFDLARVPFAYPFVAKPAQGSGGRDVCLIENREDLIGFVQRMADESFLLQRLAEMVGKDLRVFVVGDAIIGAILRTSRTDFRANYTLGGAFEPYSLSKKETQTVRKLMRMFDFDMVGMDFLFDRNHDLVFNEIEDAVGSRTLYQATNLNLADIFMKHVYITLTKGFN
ncbi:MAG: hypothetical protein WCL54_02800 [Clostridia bacterium]